VLSSGCLSSSALAIPGDVFELLYLLQPVGVPYANGAVTTYCYDLLLILVDE
jgi:hypothetical protein